MFPGYSSCGKCGLPWVVVKGRTVMTSKHVGTFAVCLDCWANSSLDELKQFYVTTYAEQARSIEGTEHKMEHALEHLLQCVERDYLAENREK